MNLWDREELSLAGKESEKPPEEEELGFSPNGSTGDPADPDVVVPLPYEVNVIDFGEPDAPSALMSNLKLTVTPDGADRGWGRLDIESTVAASKQQVWSVAVGDAVGDEDDGDLVPSLGGDVGSWTANTASNIGVVGFAVWQRSFAEQAGNYGRMVEHSTIFLVGFKPTLSRRCYSRKPALMGRFFFAKISEYLMRDNSESSHFIVNA